MYLKQADSCVWHTCELCHGCRALGDSEKRLNGGSCLRSASNPLPTRQAQLPGLRLSLIFTLDLLQRWWWIHSTCHCTLHEADILVFWWSAHMLMGLECLVELSIRMNSQGVWEKVSSNLSHKAHKRSSLTYTYFPVVIFSPIKIWDYEIHSHGAFVNYEHYKNSNFYKQW